LNESGQLVTYVSKALPAKEVKVVCRNFKTLLEAGRELEANVFLLRYASRKNIKGVNV
jgi:hypothetical protein